MVRALSTVVIDGMLWLPSKVAGHFLRPVTTMFESLDAAGDRLASMTNEELDAHFKL